MVELAETKKLLKSTSSIQKTLLSAVPSINIDEKQKREILHGEIASPINPMPGCRFAARCKHVTEICKTDDPKLMEVKAGHFVACHNI